MKKHFLLITLLLLLSSCFRQKTDIRESAETNLKYARLLRISETDGIRTATIINPWDTTSVLAEYRIDRPVSKALLCTSLHTRLLADISAVDCIAGLCDAEYVIDSAISKRVSEGKILNCGSSMSPNREAIMALSPDAVFVSPYEGADFSHFADGAARVIQCVDYLEPSPLGQAEWIRFYGMLVGRERQADSLFALVERNYLELKSKASCVDNHPRLLAELLTGQVWYVPTAHSTTGTIYKDAGADYVFAEISDTKATMPLSMEQVLAQGHDADFWIFKYYGASGDFTYASLANDNALYSSFKAFNDRNIYACNTAQVPYFDIVPFRPDLLLADMIRILHPGVLAGEPQFFKALE